MLLLATAGALAGPPVAFLIFRALNKHRRRRLALVFAAVFLLAYGLCVWPFLVEPRLLAIRQVTVDSAAWRGPDLRIGVISDTHVGAPFVTPERVAGIVQRMNAERPDVVVLLGDYVGGHEPADVRAAPERSEILQGIAPFAGLQAPFGVVAVLGNHDWWYGGPDVEAALRRADVTVLDNSSARIERLAGAFWLAGLADMESKRARPSVADALSPVTLGEPVVMLTHYPDPFASVPASVALTLAGHSHCGQVNLPVVGRLVHASRGSKRWPCGSYDEAGRKLYVTGGVGVSILPVRFRARPEIAVVTLRAAKLELASTNSAH